MNTHNFKDMCREAQNRGFLYGYIAALATVGILFGIISQFN